MYVSQNSYRQILDVCVCVCIIIECESCKFYS